MNDFRGLVVAEESCVLAPHEVSGLVHTNTFVGRPDQIHVPVALSSDAIFVAAMLSAYHVAAARPARPARLPERIILVSQIVLELLVRRELLGLKNLLISG